MKWFRGNVFILHDICCVTTMWLWNIGSASWRAGSWILTRSQCTHLRALQDKMLHSLNYVPRKPMENAGLLRNRRAKHKLPDGDEAYFGSYFSWCGHVVPHDTDRSDARKKSIFHAQKHGVAAETEAGSGLTMPRWSRQWHSVLARNGQRWHRIGHCDAQRLTKWLKWKKQKMADRSCIDLEFDGSVGMSNSSMCDIPPHDGSVSGSSEEEQHNVWNQILELFTLQGSSPVPQRCRQEEVCRVAVSCHFALDSIYMSMEWWAGERLWRYAYTEIGRAGHNF